MLHIRTKECRK